MSCRWYLIVGFRWYGDLYKRSVVGGGHVTKPFRSFSCELNNCAFSISSSCL